jgi:hypothetical protein
MTEHGRPDVSLTETIARQPRRKLACGRKWFTSAVTSQMRHLARPEGNPAGAKGLALFYLETRGGHGQLDHILLHRLKDKPAPEGATAGETTLDGACDSVQGAQRWRQAYRADAQHHARGTA